MREIYVADSETDPFRVGRIPEPFIWGLYNGIEYQEFYKTEYFLEYLTSLNKEIIVYAHNGGKFDWHFILEYLDPFSELTIINGRISKFKIDNVEFRDSFNIIPVALANYKKDEIDYNIFESEEREKPKNKKLISDYLQSDCVYLYEIVKKFLDKNGLTMTLASSAMKQWRKMSGLNNPETDKMFHDLFKSFYYGGRVQAFRKGIIDENFIVADINSAYPFAMTHDHAYGSVFYYDKTLPEKINEIQKAFIILKCESNGLFPYREKNNALSFPDDGKIREFYITGWEYLASLDINKLGDHEIINVITFEDSINFTKYVNHYHDEKQKAELNGDPAERLIAKLMLNSLYGKYGANPENYREYMVIDNKYIEASLTDNWVFNGRLGKHALIERPIADIKKHYFNVATAGSITGFQRAKMLIAINAVKNPIYCDTDSIVAQNIDNLDLGNDLGKWAIEATCIYGAVGGKKLYAFKTENGDYKTASKGVRLSASEIIRIAKGEEIEYHSSAPTFGIGKEPNFLTRKIKLT